MAESLVWAGEDIAYAAVRQDGEQDRRDRRLDRLLTSRATGIPLMLLLLAGVLWLTMAGANIPSQWLSAGLFWIEERLTALFQALGAPEWLHGALVLGMWRCLAWVVSVMLPPMAVFFPLFTLLEDFGYLPRVAFVLDHAFRKARACGKQALTMCLPSRGDADVCGGRARDGYIFQYSAEIGRFPGRNSSALREKRGFRGDSVAKPGRTGRRPCADVENRPGRGGGTGWETAANPAVARLWAMLSWERRGHKIYFTKNGQALYNVQAE